MIYSLADIKGIHPGVIIERELKKRMIGKGRFAISVNEFPQTLGAIIKGHRKMNTELSLKIERALGLEEGFLMTLQVHFDIDSLKKKQNPAPDLSILRRSLFWDTDIDKINWQEYKKSVIKRVLERGNDEEREEIKRFYGLNEQMK